MKQAKKISLFLVLSVLLVCALTVTVLAVETPPIGTGGTTGPTLNQEDEDLFEYTTYDRKVTVTGLQKNVSGALTIPETLGGYPVVEIDMDAFKGQTGITSVTMPDTVKVLDANCFEGCTALESVTLSESLETIGANAFSGCTALTEITVPDSVRTIRHYAFSGCTSLAAIDLSENVTSLGEGVFESTPWLAGQPDGPLYVGKVLYTCIGTCPAVVEVKAGTVEIATNAFYGKTTLETITFPGSLEYIGWGAFLNCSSLTSVHLPASLYGVRYDTFPSTLETITVAEESAYVVSSGCLIEANEDEGTYEVVYANGTASIPTDVAVTAIGEYVFFGRDDLLNVVLPETVTCVDLSAFAYCTALQSVSMPGVTEICMGAFSGCSSLQEITVTTALETVDFEAFSGCAALTDVYYDGSRVDKAQISIGEGNEALTAATWHTNDPAVSGDLTADGAVDSNDAIYLLYYTLFGAERYPVNENCDYNKDSAVNSNDAIYLLYHTLFGAERYPLN